jgi:flagellar basal-body rod protein FlgF
MIASLYTSAAGMLGEIAQQDAISNNLANANSSGFKRQRVGFQAFSTQLANAVNGRPSFGTAGAKSVLPVPYERQDSANGEMQDTGNSTNLAIDGPGYFVVKGSSGQERLTRDGDFRLDTANRLVTQEGDLVMGTRGPIKLPAGAQETDASGKPKSILKVGADGTITIDGAKVDRLRVELGSNSTASKPGQVVQGQIESSNVSAIQESTSMITTLRAYEASQRMIQSIDQTLDKLINTVGRA